MNAIFWAKEVLAKGLEIPIEEVPDDASIDRFEKWDSLGHLKIVLQIENEVGRTLSVQETLAVVDLLSIAEILNHRDRRA